MASSARSSLPSCSVISVSSSDESHSTDDVSSDVGENRAANKRSVVWKFFKKVPSSSKVTCNLC